MSAVYDRASKGEAAPAVSADVPGPSLEEVYSKRDAALDGVVSVFDTLPDEAREYLRSAIDRPKMPQAWSADRAEAWAKLDASTQAYIAQRELEAQQKISELGNRKSSDEFAPVLERYGSVIPRGQDGQPMAPPQVLESLLSAHHALEQNPAAAIQWLAQSYGLDLRQMAYDPTAAQQQQEVVSQYAQAMQRAQAEVAQLRAQQQQWQQQRQQHLYNQIFEYGKDKPHWAEIEQEAMHQIAAIRDANPGLFEIDPMGCLKEAEKRALSIVGVTTKNSAIEAKKKADEAKRLSSLNVRSKIGRSPSNVSGDMWSPDNWEAAYSKASGR
jgi:hypothetical protein